MRLLLHAGRCRCGLFDQGGILLGHCIHLTDGLIHLFDAVALFVAGDGDFPHDARHLLHRGDNFLHRAARLVGQIAAKLDFFDRLGNQLLDLFGGTGGALRQGAHLRRDDSKTAPQFTGARGFDSRVQGQNIGLKGDAVNHGNDLDDTL